ncbi:hypothetical protein EDC04DRAFT_2606920 [Pisolithus marmoratus]|nr:hypothetical protein EDC04DRAFT_2606920 [Pisolithus marmoratus]
MGTSLKAGCVLHRGQGTFRDHNCKPSITLHENPRLTETKHSLDDSKFPGSPLVMRTVTVRPLASGKEVVTLVMWTEPKDLGLAIRKWNHKQAGEWPWQMPQWLKAPRPKLHVACLGGADSSYLKGPQDGPATSCTSSDPGGNTNSGLPASSDKSPECCTLTARARTSFPSLMSRYPPIQERMEEEANEGSKLRRVHYQVLGNKASTRCALRAGSAHPRIALPTNNRQRRQVIEWHTTILTPDPCFAGCPQPFILPTCGGWNEKLKR